MTSTSPFTLRWGILSTGSIATEFAMDLLVDPATRNSDMRHVIAAVGSRSVESADRFVDKLKASTGPWSWGVQQGLLTETKAYGSYAEVCNDPNVDVVYVGTPVTLHHADAKMALLAGKHVLCEKCFTFDLAELDDLIAIAREKNLFLMEAVWTRFHPIAYKIQDVVFSGRLGKPKRFQADFSIDFNVDARPTSDRFLDPALGGGSLLDMGPYPSVWAMLLLYQHPDNRSTAPKFVNSYQRIYRRTNVDERSRWLLDFENLECEAQLMTDMTTHGLREATAVLQCQDGDLIIEFGPQKPSTFHIVPRNGERETYHYPIAAEQGHGLCFEADEVAQCIRDGKTESERMPLSESRVAQSWLDEVRRRGTTCMKDMKGKA
ncbi:uncharacterized protein CcaverHIS019_0511570 [Cutaneotrichosporon cavernicola]|uniref:D-xylose 1-dehydrogenase (NADP(+), D-xylono-1,5-lactone-forming) n=1 Tax=Cutaneotrichosporon cavernicola TaxID=279322 RepID=A0AA48L7Q0_9TREE|nr:uncharacterized protein CcaverHIS019_0511570 [Cutaneotrichosporon cavernicola]BEI93529.1 hypothetical protein CcaverHIS019_0511570 [Cutaneotrichosporon cavernicola]BEJ01308.1 hypothetical protein CcaverHIS631_0511650 [Cutaneotrichosporon cavernicola]BEJ09075.1 hypothetical protein CcaverHIS641_0511690 [Cutaneotrichosporon cavernicola]